MRTYIVPFTHDVIVLEQNTTVQKRKEKLYRWRTNRGFIYIYIYIYCIRKLCLLPWWPLLKVKGVQPLTSALLFPLTPRALRVTTSHKL